MTLTPTLRHMQSSVWDEDRAGGTRRVKGVRGLERTHGPWGPFYPPSPHPPIFTLNERNKSSLVLLLLLPPSSFFTFHWAWIEKKVCLILSSYSENHIHNHFGNSHAENFNLKQILAKFMLISKIYQVKSNLLKMKIFVLINTILDYKSYEFSAFLFKLKKRATLCFSCGSAASKHQFNLCKEAEGR